jgi:hypothetical protein
MLQLRLRLRLRLRFCDGGDLGTEGEEEAGRRRSGHEERTAGGSFIVSQ